MCFFLLIWLPRRTNADLDQAGDLNCQLKQGGMGQPLPCIDWKDWGKQNLLWVFFSCLALRNTIFVAHLVNINMCYWGGRASIACLKMQCIEFMSDLVNYGNLGALLTFVNAAQEGSGCSGWWQLIANSHFSTFYVHLLFHSRKMWEVIATIYTMRVTFLIWIV